MLAPVPGQAAFNDPYLDKIQPILSKRCVACHGCYEAPCQLNLQSYEGVRRGYNPIPVYSGKRIPYTPPTRLKDGNNLTDWRAQQFLPVVASDDEPSRSDRADRFEDGLLFQLIHQGAENDPQGFSTEDTSKLQAAYEEDKRQCLATPAQFQEHFSGTNKHNVLSFEEYKKLKNAGMPFGLPKLQTEEEATLKSWLAAGAPGPSAEAQAKLEESADSRSVNSWEIFLNGDSAKAQQTARYIYEHVFSALIHFDDYKANYGEYYELVRSSTREGKIDEMVTELPYDAPPQGARVYYRFKKVTRSIVQKTQNIWRLDDVKLAHYQEMFLNSDWKVREIPLPTYDSNNMFEYFSVIPADIRSRFMWENSRLIVGAMVQGTVCIGSRATYAIADHFWAYFLKQDMDPSVQNPSLGLESLKLLGTAPQPFVPRNKIERALFSLAEKTDLSKSHLAAFIVRKIREHKGIGGNDEDDKKAAELIVQMKLEGVHLSDVIGAIVHFHETKKANEAYQQAYEMELRKLLKSKGRRGLSTRDLWTGDRDPSYPEANNPNAWLNITRHEKSATVQFGPEGGIPQSIWIMSYSNFERLYYNLVVHFKVWGSITHKLATWRHMSYVRLEGEDLAISVLPMWQREEVRAWFSHGLGGVANEVFYPHFSTMDLDSNPPRGLGRLNPFHRTDLPARNAADYHLMGKTPRETVQKFVNHLGVKFSDVAIAGRYGMEMVTEAQYEWDRDLRALQNVSEKRNGDSSYQGEKFAQAMPNISYVRVQADDGSYWVYTLLANRGYKSHTIVVAENPEKEPELDTLSVYRGLVGAYPNLFLDVKRENRAQFAADIRSLQSSTDFKAFRAKYAVERNQPGFWEFFDWLHEWKNSPHPGVDPVEQGIADLSQYLF